MKVVQVTLKHLQAGKRWKEDKSSIFLLPISPINNVGHHLLIAGDFSLYQSRSCELVHVKNPLKLFDVKKH